MTALRTIPRPLFWLLLAASLLVRAAVPAGWMPVNHVGEITVELCGGVGGHVLKLGKDGRLHDTTPDPSHAAAHETCPFALAAVPLVAPVVAAVVPAMLPALAPAPQAWTAAALLPAPFRRPPGQAPPAKA